MHRPACVQWSADCRLILSPFRPSPSPATRASGRRGRVMCEAKGGEPGAHRGKSMHARVQEFVSSCHVPSFSATPTGGGQTCVGLYEGVNMCWPVRGLQVPSRRPACLLPAPVLSARQSIRPFIHLSRTPKVLARHNRVTRLITHGSHPLATPFTQDFSVPRLRFRSACMLMSHV